MAAKLIPHVPRRTSCGLMLLPNAWAWMVGSRAMNDARRCRKNTAQDKPEIMTSKYKQYCSIILMIILKEFT